MTAVPARAALAVCGITAPARNPHPPPGGNLSHSGAGGQLRPCAALALLAAMGSISAPFALLFPVISPTPEFLDARLNGRPWPHFRTWP